jgi:Co/Zn/Cd efflux system component
MDSLYFLFINFNMSSSPTKITENLKDGILINFAICGFVGLILNVLLFWVLVKRLKKSAHTDVKICAFVAFMDIFASVGLLFRSIAAKYPYNIFKEHPNWCKFEILIVTQGINCSGYTLGVMSMERLLLICFNLQLSIWFWVFIIVFIFVTIFAFSILCVVNNLQSLTSTEVSCTYANAGVCYYGLIATAGFFFFSFTSVLVSYLGIVIVKSEQCLNQINLNIPKDMVYKELKSTLIKSIVYIMLYVLIYIMKFYGLAFTVITGRKRSLYVEVISQMLISYSSIVNALILLYMNQDVRVTFIELLKRIKFKLLNR